MSAKTLMDKLQNEVEKMGIGHHQRHIFLCVGPDCCASEKGLESWNYLKNRLKELGLTSEVFRTKVGCLRVCTQGPIALVYPDGTWYHSVSVEVCEEIIQRHLVGGEVVEEFAFANAPLPALENPAAERGDD